ncbi:hypothetical protein K435DRAFT_866784 [Dendrothele bispora CBS 962.96]|uniref:Uncharacterized protein n=1 Tax=Dendrothele bispora (strain CBS 962.96) TaxID=1314807 RepID=A0A4S8LGD2_DENBC|nr:hypothetical protein K435DRAFT_866784 [Dendrothele bispora CBS 962.96]
MGSTALITDPKAFDNSTTFARTPVSLTIKKNNTMNMMRFNNYNIAFSCHQEVMECGFIDILETDKPNVEYYAVLKGMKPEIYDSKLNLICCDLDYRGVLFEVVQESKKAWEMFDEKFRIGAAAMLSSSVED